MFSFLPLVITLLIVKFFINYFTRINKTRRYNKNYNKNNYRKKKTLNDLRNDKSNSKSSYNYPNVSSQMQNKIVDETNNREKHQKLFDNDFNHRKNDNLELIRVEINDEFKHNDELKKAIIMKEIIDKPLSLRNRR